jgi:putative tryptophan/tyrosine transport system substrate-binding protein
MRRRDFIKGIVGSTAFPLAAHAQRSDQVRRIGVLMNFPSTDPEGQALLAEFTRSLAELGWTEGRNVRIDVRWGASNVDLLRTFAKELVGFQPDVLLATSTPATAALASETQTIPIVFALVADPISSRFVVSLSHPGGNITGFSVFEASIISKSLELLREIAPGIKRIAMIFNPDTAPYVNSLFMPVFETAAKSFNIAPIAAPVHNDAEIQSLIRSAANPAVPSLADQTISSLTTAPRSYRWRRATICLRFLRTRSTSETAVLFPTPQTSETILAVRPAMWTISCEAQNHRSFLCKCR